MDLSEMTMGSFGPWQRRLFVLFFYTGVVGIWQNLSITFMAPNMEYWCVDPPTNSTLTDQCHVEEGSGVVPCRQWDYDTSYFSNTIVNEWDLVCDRAWLVSLSKSVYMVGFLLSVFFFGQLSDWVGRYPVILIAYTITVVSMFLSLLSTSYVMFIVLRFFQAFGRTGLTTTGYVLIMEVVGSEHRTKVGIGVQLGWSFGFVCLAGIAFLFRHWFWLQLVMSIPILPIAIGYWIVPESPRWLLMRGRIERLEKLLKRACKINGRELKLERKDLEILRTQNEGMEKKTVSLLDLFKTPRLRSRTFNMIYLWFVNAFMYYALSFNTNDLAGDPYINFMVAGILEFPSYAVVYWGIKSFGRRPTLVSLMVVGGCACAATPLAPNNGVSTALSMTGKFCISGSFGLLYLYTSELFPTVVRNVAIGSCSMFARVGSILAPFVKELGKATYPWLPNVVYGLLALSSGLLALLLPETRGRHIPDTLQQGEECFFEEQSQSVDLKEINANR